MTAIEPAPLRSRQGTSNQITRTADPVGNLSEKMQMARAMADTDKSNNQWDAMLPASYRGSVGACLMAIDFAERNQLSLIEVLGQVSFSAGRSTVSARLQRKLAARAGYITRRISGDDTQCTVGVYHGDQLLGEATYTYAQAEKLGIIYTGNNPSKGLKSTWAGDPAQMLYHRATTRALDYYGPADESTMFVEDYDLVDDPADIARPPAPAAAIPAAVVETVIPSELPLDEPAGKMVPPRTPISVPVVDIGDETIAAKLARLGVEAGVKESTMLTQARRAGHTTLTVPSEIADNAAAAADVIQWLQEKIAAKADQ